MPPAHARPRLRSAFPFLLSNLRRVAPFISVDALGPLWIKKLPQRINANELTRYEISERIYFAVHYWTDSGEESDKPPEDNRCETAE